MCYLCCPENHKTYFDMANPIQCLIIGSGPAGFTAAIYTARANLSPVLYEGIEPGGQLTTTTHIENFPGFPEMITGQELMDNMKRQAHKFGTDIRFGIVTEVDFSARPFKVTVDGRHQLETQSVIIATGATANYLGLESEQRLRGMGVSACATCDGFFYRGKDVAVVGGGDTACEEAAYLSTICNKVYMVVRKGHLRASKAMQNKVMTTPNIHILFQHTTQQVLGDDEQGVTGVLLNDKDGKNVVIDVSGFFLAIGHNPNTEVFSPFIETDTEGYIIVEPGTSKTNIAGIFAAGDVKDPHYKQAISAAGSGCVAALDCEKYLMTL